jgi:hypothetical protein
MSSAETPAPYIELSIGSSIIGEGGTANIDSSPQMPQLVARVKPDGLSGNVSWSMAVSYSRHRNDSNNYPASGSPKTLPTTTPWNIYGEFGTAFCGGNATISANYNGLSLSRTFKIRGLNPVADTAKSYVGTSPWYACPIAKTESQYRQFNVTGSYQGEPNWGSPNGWGIMQLDTPPATVQQLWNWQANVAGGKALIADPCIAQAQVWMASQETQQQAEEPSKPLENCIFTFNGVDFRKGISRTPIDACAIQRYNGVSGGWVIYWQNKTPTQPGQWMYYSNNVYVCAVCGNI